MTMRIWSMVEGSLNYLRVGRRNKGNTGEGREGRGLSRIQRVCLVSCCLRVGCFCRCFGCFGILEEGELKGTRKRYYGGDILAGVCSWWRAKTPPTTEWFSPAMVNTSASCVLEFATNSGHSVRTPPLFGVTLSLVI